MSNKREWVFTVFVLCAFIFLVLMILFYALTNYVTLDKNEHTYHEIEFIRYRPANN